jgi:hypothetical protein
VVDDETASLFKTGSEEIMKYIAIVIFFCLGVFFFNYRYLMPEAGIASRSPDYSTHISIEQHLKEGQLFPEFGKAEKGLHAVSNYLPIYHGLLGFHATAWLLELLGMPLPGAYLFLMDLSLAVCLLFFGSLLLQELKRERRWEFLAVILTIATIFISNFTRAVDQAFFPQIMAYALLILAWQLWGTERRILGYFLVMFAIGTYPDFLIWALPVLIFDKRISLQIAFRVGLGLIWTTLIYTLFTRKNLPGPDAVSLYPLVFLPILVGLFWKSLHQGQRTFLLCLISYTTVTIGFLIASQSNFTWSYYALKLTYPSVFFLLYALIKLPLVKSRRGRSFIAIYVFFFWGFSDVSWSSVARYFARNDIVNNKTYSSMLTTKSTIEQLDGQCQPDQTLVLPSQSDIPPGTEVMLGLWARNSLLLNSDIYSGFFKDSTLRAVFGKFLDFEKFYRNESLPGNQRFFSTLKRSLPLEHDICIVSPESERSLFNGNPCFVILKEEGGQIYAQCKAKTEL